MGLPISNECDAANNYLLVLFNKNVGFSHALSNLVPINTPIRLQKSGEQLSYLHWYANGVVKKIDRHCVVSSF